MGEIKLKKRYKYAGDIFSKLIDIKFDVETATAFLNDIKDADVVEVVRCKDCRLAKEDILLDGFYHCENNGLSHRADHFCSYGERKEK